MIFFVIILLLLVLINKYDVRLKGKPGLSKSPMRDIILYLILVSIPIFSYEIGSDVVRYNEWYTLEVKPLNSFSFNDFRYEPLFCLLMSVFKTIGFPWFCVYALIICFINYTVFSFGRKYIKPFYTFILLYLLLHFYEINFESIRQALAMGFFLLSIPILEKGNRIKYYFYILIALGFHVGAVLALLLPFLKNIKFNFINCTALVLILIVGDYLSTHFSDLLFIVNMLGADDYYEAYFDADLNKQLNLNGIIVLVLPKIIPIILSVKMIKKSEVTTLSYLEGACFLLTACIALRAALAFVDRLVLFWSIIECAVLSEGLFAYTQNRDGIRIKLAKAFIILSVCLSAFLYYNAENKYGFKNYRRFYPYNSVFNKHVDAERRNNQLYIE